MNPKSTEATHNQLRANVEQQTKRLLCQLQELDCEQLDEEEKQELKVSTLEELQIFQQSLDNMLSDPSNSVLESEIEKNKRLIFESVKQRFNKDEIKGRILSHQVKGLRNQVKELSKAYKLKQMAQKDYVSATRKLIVEIEESGADLTEEEQLWLKGHENFQEAVSGEQKDSQEQRHVEAVGLKEAQEQIKNSSGKS